MLDVVTMGETMAVFTPASRGKLRYVKDFNLRIAGAESNLAIGMQKLGYGAGWISKLGDDELGQVIIHTLRGEGVDLSNVTIDAGHPTGMMIKEFTGLNETNVYYYRKGSAASSLTPGDIDEEYVKKSKIVHLTGITPLLSDSCYEAVKRIIDIAKENNILISFDPNIRLKLCSSQDAFDRIKSILFQANIVLMGLSEAEILFNLQDIEAIFSLMKDYENIKFLAVKDGANGAWVGNREEYLKIEPQKCTPVDPVGAGDAFNAGFLSGILEGLDLKTCGQIGAICGALATQTYGDFEGFPSRKEVLHILENTKQIHR
ncbi:MAG: sugar kinase [Caldicoprobacterales bacterium]|nr:sugar kinase [Clostridiales bacterium]